MIDENILPSRYPVTVEDESGGKYDLQLNDCGMTIYLKHTLKDGRTAEIFLQTPAWEALAATVDADLEQAREEARIHNAFVEIDKRESSVNASEE